MKAGDRGFRQLPHTADVMLEAWGPDISRALGECVRGFTSLVTDVAAVGTREERSLSLRADSREKLLYDLIDQLIYLKDTKSYLASDASFTVTHEKGSWSLVGTLRGQSLHDHPLADVKAMTYHGMRITDGNGTTTIAFTVDL